jgi:peptide-methionine (S)-S-oxide reductase
VAETVVARLNAAKLWNKPIVTEVTPATDYYAAEGYHQEYYASNPDQPYCRAVVAPKVQKFRKAFLEKLKRPA